MNYQQYEMILHAVLDDEIQTVRSMGWLLGEMDEKSASFVAEYLRERRRTGNSGRVPEFFKSMKIEKAEGFGMGEDKK